jgi:peptidyl-prolyl cis-trans isomerase NIMA-interacting 1
MRKIDLSDMTLRDGRSTDSRGLRWERAIGLALLMLTACGKGGAPAGSGPSASAAPGAASAPVVAAPASSPPVAASSAGMTPTGTPPASAADVAPPDTIIAQHVLVVYKGAKRAPKGVTRTKAEARSRAQEALDKIRSGVAFEDVVKAYSDDAGSVDRMGSLGKFHRGDMDPTFAAAAFALKVGQVSDVVQTPFGFHVIKRTQ